MCSCTWWLIKCRNDNTCVLIHNTYYFMLLCHIAINHQGLFGIRSPLWNSNWFSLSCSLIKLTISSSNLLYFEYSLWELLPLHIPYLSLSECLARLWFLSLSFLHKRISLVVTDVSEDLQRSRFPSFQATKTECRVTVLIRSDHLRWNWIKRFAGVCGLWGSWQGN